jgi:CubicO group peptidase (beta-lactamase class C family)
MRPEWRGVTLEQLLAHRSGAPHDAPPDLWKQAWAELDTPTQQRLDFVHGLITRAPEAPPGTKYIYSNQGYAIAGAMLERIAGKPWEELMRTMLFEPLGMKSAGFGAPAAPGEIDQPWGHDAQLTPIPPGKQADNPPAIGPAGTVHCSLADLARYAAMHATGEKGGSSVLGLGQEYFVKLHTAPAGQDYAMGWIVARRAWGGNGPVLNHVGSNTMFLVNIWVAPAKNAVFIAATNTGDSEAFPATDDAIGVMIRAYLTR